MKEINELFNGIINQAKYVNSKHNCGDSENLIYMASELREYFKKYINEEKQKLQEALNLLENMYQ